MSYILWNNWGNTCTRFPLSVHLFQIGHFSVQTLWSICMIHIIGCTPQQSVPITPTICKLSMIPTLERCTGTYCNLFSSSLSVICERWSFSRGFLRVLWFPPPIKLTGMIYYWNIVESSIKHHKPSFSLGGHVYSSNKTITIK